jgi:predicted GNAT family acetyltransferase
MGSNITVVRRGDVYFVKLDDGSKAYLAVKEDPERRIMELVETYTPPQHRGKGIAKAMMKKAVEDARSKGLKIVPICSYSVYYFLKYPEERDVLADEFRNMSDEELRRYFEERLAAEKGH